MRSLSRHLSIGRKFFAHTDEGNTPLEKYDRQPTAVLRPKRSLGPFETGKPLEAILEGSMEATLSRIPQVLAERAAALTQISELLLLSPLERERTLVAKPYLNTYSLVVLALERSEEMVSFNPGAVRELAQFARSIIPRVDPQSCGGAEALADLEAYAWAMEGNALRISGAFQRGLVAFTAARRIQESGGIDLDLMARIDHLESSLRRDLRQLDTAIALLDRAAKLFKSIEDHEQLARTVINRSNIFLVQGDFGQASAILEHVRSFVRDPYLNLCVNHNLADILVRSGRPKEAAELLEQTRSLYLDYANPLLDSRRFWVAGLIARDLDEDLDLASTLLMEATNLLVDHGYNSSFIGLDLQLLQVKTGEATRRSS